MQPVESYQSFNLHSVEWTLFPKLQEVILPMSADLILMANIDHCLTGQRDQDIMAHMMYRLTNSGYTGSCISGFNANNIVLRVVLDTQIHKSVDYGRDHDSWVKYTAAVTTGNKITITNRSLRNQEKLQHESAETCSDEGD